MATQIGGQGAAWSDGGIIQSGRVVSYNKRTVVDLEEVPGADGEPAGAITHNSRTEHEYEIAVLTGTTAPAVGSTMTVGDTSIIVTEAGMVGGYKQITKLRIKGVKYAGF